MGSGDVRTRGKDFVEKKEMKAALRGLLLSRLSIGDLRSVLRETIQAKKLAGQEVWVLLPAIILTLIMTYTLSLPITSSICSITTI